LFIEVAKTNDLGPSRMKAVEVEGKEAEAETCCRASDPRRVNMMMTD
jgi:hypothetical protein